MPIFGSNPPATEAKYISVYERSVRSSKRCPEAECTETIGFESMSLKSADHFSDGIEPPAMEIGEADRSATEVIVQERRKKDPERRRNFPPVLTILNGNGRPRFNFTKESTADGRMTMRMVPSEGKEIMRCFRGDGRLRMELIGTESSDGEDSEDCGSCDGYGEE